LNTQHLIDEEEMVASDLTNLLEADVSKVGWYGPTGRSIQIVPIEGLSTIVLIICQI